MKEVAIVRGPAPICRYECITTHTVLHISQEAKDPQFTPVSLQGVTNILGGGAYVK